MTNYARFDRTSFKIFLEDLQYFLENVLGANLYLYTNSQFSHKILSNNLKIYYLFEFNQLRTILFIRVDMLKLNLNI